MELKKAFNLLKNLPNKLNSFYIKKSKTSLVVSNKSKNLKDFNPVTNIDRLFEKYIRSEIKKNFPKDGIIGEEYKDKESFNDFKWSIDPIDGTKAFVIGLPNWSNLISFSYKEEPLFGLANFPDLDKYYLNDENRSYLFKNKKKKRIKSSKNNNLKKITILGNFHGILTEKYEKRIIKKFGHSFRSVSLDALAYCLLAEGKVDVVLEANLKPYDILPLIPIIKNSGGIVTNWKNQSAINGGNVLATSNKRLHIKILKILKNFTKKNILFLIL